MTREEMREKVAKAMAATHGYKPDALTYREADAAIAIIRGETLEEAARMAERVADGEAVKCRNALIDDEDDDIALRHADKEGGARDCAAAIRALKEGK